ncbi:hypothetical protein VOLCADRAFT_97140 [Volvox carteri f. nagariensis]|uniref:Uncharacterized protein n=1 Tax=Volvox carteri f. nagariensis TaxID=3068 RepID=D8UBZ7_VOLCA|nr:uncharacterized protein VOLCADRAFT_97140 [Volvox carteri f. nagariensis]EFJ42708.1 hypothetical protein VOLCADRAFT_97140 [Volvox carteri f. nagariensis]|eukprot:XP_002956169.1 hypothetical protein VOLCADRAFT_97140 [Volvox carteri f. nagariensis]
MHVCKGREKTMMLVRASTRQKVADVCNSGWLQGLGRFTGIPQQPSEAQDEVALKEATLQRMEALHHEQTPSQQQQAREAAQQCMEALHREQTPAISCGRLLVAVSARCDTTASRCAVLNIPITVFLEAGGLEREVAFAQELEKFVRSEMPMWLSADCSCIHSRSPVHHQFCKLHIPHACANVYVKAGRPMGRPTFIDIDRVRGRPSSSYLVRFRVKRLSATYLASQISERYLANARGGASVIMGREQGSTPRTGPPGEVPPPQEEPADSSSKSPAWGRPRTGGEIHCSEHWQRLSLLASGLQDVLEFWPLKDIKWRWFTQLAPMNTLSL